MPLKLELRFVMTTPSMRVWCLHRLSNSAHSALLILFKRKETVVVSRDSIEGAVVSLKFLHVGWARRNVDTPKWKAGVIHSSLKFAVNRSLKKANVAAASSEAAPRLCRTDRAINLSARTNLALFRF